MTRDPDVVELALAMPKAELHVHIEGTLEPSLAFALARRNNVELPFADEAALARAYDFDDLQSFLDLYYACTEVLRTRADFADLALAYLERAAGDGVVRAEMFFDPQSHTSRGVAFETVLDGLHDGIVQAQRRWGISGALILCFLRHLPEADCLDTLQEALPHLDRLAGFGLDSSERGHPPTDFARLFERCRATGLPVVAHAGEEGPPEYITQALDVLGARRIDHGVRAIEDPAVLARLVEEGVPLTVCPLSNLKLKVVDAMTEHCLPKLLAAGARVTINSDDPSYFGGYLGDNIRAVQEAFDLDIATWHRLARTSLEASFADADAKAGWLERLDELPGG